MRKTIHSKTSNELQEWRNNPPIYTLVWNKDLELWDLEISESELRKIDVIGLLKQIDDYEASIK